MELVRIQTHDLASAVRGYTARTSCRIEALDLTFTVTTSIAVRPDNHMKSDKFEATPFTIFLTCVVVVLVLYGFWCKLTGGSCSWIRFIFQLLRLVVYVLDALK